MSILIGALGAGLPRTAVALSAIDLLFSGQAMLIYLFVIVIVVAILVFTLALGDHKGSAKDQNITVEGSVAPASASASEDEIRGERFCMLSQIDRNKGKYGQKRYESGITLEYFCESFRNYAASNLKLYYDIEDIRRFVAGMGVSRMLILQGMSGTGKTSLAHAFGSFVDNSSTVIKLKPRSLFYEKIIVQRYAEFAGAFPCGERSDQ